MTPTATSTDQSQVRSGFVSHNGRELYEIHGVDSMAPFLMTVVGDTDLWMYLSSAGSFTAGRVEPDRCIFPYETDDRLHELGGLSGPITMIRFEDGRLWRPLDARAGASSASRVLRRSPVGDLVEFEETDAETGLRFRVEYSLVDSLGVVRRAWLELDADREAVAFELLDGYRNIMPASVPLVLQQQMSTLIDGYKRSELAGSRGPAIYMLEAAISDSPQAKEALRTNAVWHVGLEQASIDLDDAACRRFERGTPLEPTHLATGRRGSYLLSTKLSLNPGSDASWVLVADANLDHSDIVALRAELEADSFTVASFSERIDGERARLAQLLADADASQCVNDPVTAAAHQSNVLFNLMRGGVPIDGHNVDPADFRRFVGLRNVKLAEKHAAFLDGLSPQLRLQDLASEVAAAGDAQLQRVAMEYLPLTFGRRHGDPSRPWNRYRIRVRDENGERVTGYEGNWRDIFQNWEATCRSYPAMLPHVIAKFLNASTADGYNPYRINEQGIDWEEPEPENPRSNIGYWGDHQIVYLHRLLEQCGEANPKWLQEMAHARVFAYSDVPYRIKAFAEIAADARSSISFDENTNEQLRSRMDEIGGDGVLLNGPDGSPLLVNLVEKILVPALAKVANLVPNGGIWMNTQRPEWNDANNALAGYGLSMVTLYQLRAYADWCIDFVESLSGQEIPISGVIARWCQETNDVMVQSLDILEPIDDSARWTVLSSLNGAAEVARSSLYQNGLGKPVATAQQTIADFFKLTRHLCDRSIANAKREDGLFESYRVLHLGVERAAVESLDPMLEGQVSILASGVLKETESLELLGTLFESPLYREDQATFILYPRQDLPAFIERNAIPEAALSKSPLLLAALDTSNWRLAHRDTSGTPRFDADLVSHDALQHRLDALKQDATLAALIDDDRGAVSHAFERTFQHARFTGRSSTMHKYEGLGSVYWHMVSKLLLAVQETAFRASDAQAPSEQVDELCSYYRRVRAGLGYQKSPQVFGAVPFEPYSHTPWNMGAQQPGMTGQVKEGVLARLGEIGARIRDGQLSFDPLLFEDAELLGEHREFPAAGLSLGADSAAFTLCGIPVTLSLGAEDQLEVIRSDGTAEFLSQRTLSTRLTESLFARDGSIARINAQLCH